ncbi:MAG: molybdopterin-dependent oxidoreductase [Syntrophomonas sp.]|nr:molybdopterin-dependent oxidoreductase [Syntrophomonas sp.]
MQKNINKCSLFLLLLTIMLTVAACGGKSETASPAAYDNEEILITGLKDSDYKISVGDLKKLPSLTKKSEASTADGEIVKAKATGTLLENVLQQEGKSIKDYSSIRFTAQDGYSIAVPQDVLKNRPIILAYELDGKPLVAENQPIMVVVPGERAMYWVRMLDRIELKTGAQQTPVKKVVFLETAVKSLPQEDYQYYDSVDKAIKTQDLVESYAGTDEVNNVFIKAGDELNKNESQSNFIGAYIKMTGKEAPKFLAPKLPQGMHVKDVLCINYGESGFFAYSQGKKVLSPKTLDGQSGIALSEVIKQTGLSRAAKYKFSSGDGQSLEFTVNELGSVLIYQNDQGILVSRCPGAADKNVENLLSIECMK